MRRRSRGLGTTAAPARATSASRLRCGLSVLLVLASLRAGADTPDARAERIVADYFQRSGSPGLSVSVGWCDRLVWSRGFGFADIEQQVRVDPATTRFRIGSVAKPMTALALVMLAGNNRVDLDADVRRYVPAFPKKEHDFTVRQLAGHLAGIRHYAGKDEVYGRKHYATVMESLEIFADDPLIAVPGAEWKYSSYGYNLLSAVIESAAGEPFLAYLSESVLLPVGMTSTVPDRLESIVPHRGRYYLRRDGSLYNEPEVDNSNKWASGGLLSTTDDLVRFGLAHFDDRLVTEEMRQLLWTELKTTAGTGTGYGIGWRIVVDEAGHTWLGHGGGSIGGTTQFWLFPDNQLVIAAVGNLTDLDYSDLIPRLRTNFVEGLEQAPRGPCGSQESARGETRPRPNQRVSR
jgi:serine beta-lactamase-like protein LACTB